MLQRTAEPDDAGGRAKNNPPRPRFNNLDRQVEIGLTPRHQDQYAKLRKNNREGRLRPGTNVDQQSGDVVAVKVSRVGPRVVAEEKINDVHKIVSLSTDCQCRSARHTLTVPSSV